MNLTLRPGETFYSIWIPSDPSDATTYYPQTVFRLASDWSVLSTVSLAKQTDGSYKGSFSVPGDSSGLGFYIVETMNVYTDSLHTTLSTTYAQTQNTYKVKNELQNYGGSSVDRTDYNYIEKLVKKIVEEAVATIHFEQKETDLSNLEKILKEIKDTQDPHGIALQLLDKKLKGISKKEIVFPKGEYEKHFINLYEGLINMDKSISLKHDLIEPIVKKHTEKYGELFNKTHKEMREIVDNILSEIKWRFENVDSMIYKKNFEPERPKEKIQEPNYLELAKKFL